MKLERTKKITEADYAQCQECGMIWDAWQPYWSLSKSVGLHRSGGHTRIALFRTIDDSTIEPDRTKS